jgi:hypothetical protein
VIFQSQKGRGRRFEILKPRAKIYFLTPSQLQSFVTGKELRVVVRVLLSSSTSSPSTPLNVNIEVRTIREKSSLT